MIRHRSIGIGLLTALMAQDRMMRRDASVQRVDGSGTTNAALWRTDQRPSSRRSQVSHGFPAAPGRQAHALGHEQPSNGTQPASRK